MAQYYLTEQVRMYAMTGKTEYYSMRLVAESYGKSEESLPEEIREDFFGIKFNPML